MSHNKVQAVVATGIGIDPDKARQNAVRNAVEQVVGVYITSDTMVNNSKLIKDEILSHSAGYVNETKIISSEKTDDGLFLIKIKAIVVSSILVDRLKNLGLISVKIDNSRLVEHINSKLDNDRSKIEEKASANALIDAFIDSFPDNVYQINAGELEIGAVNSQSNITNIKLPISIRWADNYINNLISLLKKTNKKQYEFEKVLPTLKDEVYNSDKDEDMYCFASKNNIKEDIMDYCLITDNAKMYNRIIANKKLKVKILFKNNNGDAIKALIVDLYSDCFQHQFGNNRNSNYICAEQNAVPNTIKSLKTGYVFIKDGEYTTNITSGVNVDILKQTSSMDIAIVK